MHYPLQMCSPSYSIAELCKYLKNKFWGFLGHLFYVHASLRTANQHRPIICPVHQYGKIGFSGDVKSFGYHNLKTQRKKSSELELHLNPYIAGRRCCIDFVLQADLFLDLDLFATPDHYESEFRKQNFTNLMKQNCTCLQYTATIMCLFLKLESG